MTIYDILIEYHNVKTKSLITRHFLFLTGGSLRKNTYIQGEKLNMEGTMPQTSSRSNRARIVLVTILVLGSVLGALIAISMSTTQTAPPMSNKSIAIVDDDADVLFLHTFAAKKVTTGQIDTYITCDLLLSAMDLGKRYSLYILDHRIVGSRYMGPACAEQILLRHPGAIILGNSSDDGVGKEFIEKGATEFTPKGIDLKKFQDLIIKLLGG